MTRSSVTAGRARAGLKAMFAQFPQRSRRYRRQLVPPNQTVVLHEKVARAPDGDKFEVMSIYTFEGDKVSRVEFIR